MVVTISIVRFLEIRIVWVPVVSYDKYGLTFRSTNI